MTLNKTQAQTSFAVSFNSSSGRFNFSLIDADSIFNSVMENFSVKLDLL